MSLRGPAQALGAYLWVRAHGLTLRSPRDVVRHQARQLRRFLQRDVPRVGFYREFAGKSVALGDLPITDKALIMGDFAAFNRPKITAAEGWAAFEGARQIGRYTVGASTGTSGNRGLFVISEAERFRWLGTILAKALPDFWRRRHRVAIVLPLATALYESANETRAITLRFFDISEGPERWAEDLARFDPTVLVAPPRLLTWLGREVPALQPGRVFSAAETLDPVDLAPLTGRFGHIGQIYMATEGLFAVSCPEGRLHLLEDRMHFEMEPLAGGLVSPLITDFSRSTQIMARYRMNDLLRMSEAPCPCGSPLRAVDEVVGRRDDAFEFARAAGPVLVTPDVLRNAIVDADRRITDYRLRKQGGQITLHVPPALPPEAGAAARAAVEALLVARGVAAPVGIVMEDLRPEMTRKLRRIEVIR